MCRMIQNETLSFPLFQRAKIIRAANPFRKVVIRLLLDREKYYWVAMMDFEYNRHDTYYVGKNLDEAIEYWESEKGSWGR